MFDTATYRKARTFRPEIDHTPELTGFDYSPDGTTIATARGHSGAFIWNAADPGRPVPPDGKPLRPFFGVDEVYALEKPLHVLEPRGSPDEFASVLSIKYSPDGKLVFTTHHDGHMKIWSTSTWTLQRELMVSEKGNSALFAVLAISPDGESLVVGDESGVLHYRSLAANSELRTLRSPDGTHRITGLQFSPNGKLLVATYAGKRAADASAVLWNTDNWTTQTITGYGSSVFSRDSQLLALGGADIIVIDPRSRKELLRISLPPSTKAEVLPNSAIRSDAKDKNSCLVSALAISPQNTTLAAGCFEGTLLVLKLRQ
jgi:WD40 repeat protein